MQTTMRKIRAAGPCGLRLEDGKRVGYLKLRHYLGKGYGDDTPVDIATILDSNGLDDALWCLRAVDGHAREMRLYAVWCARQVQSLMEDQRSLTALDVAERYANGAASNDELDAARDAARDAAWKATSAGWKAAQAGGAWAAWKAASAAACAVNAAAWDAARDAAWDAAWAAARDAAWAAAGDAITPATQAVELQRICAEMAAGRDPYPAAGEVTP